MAEKETSMRDDLDAAIEAGESEQPENEEYYEEGREAAQETEKEEVSEEAVREDPDQPEEDRVDDPADKPAKAAKGPTAPVDWSPTVKDKWNKLDPDVQQAIVKRERDTNILMEKTVSERKLAEEFIRTMEPHRAHMAAEGIQNPIHAIQGLMNTAAVLKFGSPQQKAKKFAEMCNHYTIDIELLDSELAGEQLPQEQQQPQRDPEVQYFIQRMKQAEQNQQQQVIYNATSTVDEFRGRPEHEFVNYTELNSKGEPVRIIEHMMADKLDIARNKNEQMSLDDAYEKSVWEHPETRKVLLQRLSYGGKGMMEQKKNAASSISGRRGSGSDISDPDKMSMRDLIAAQFGDTGRI